MAADGKTEQPTERRRTKARDKGQVARSRELSAAFATGAVLLWLSSRGTKDVLAWRHFFAQMMAAAAPGTTLDVSVLQRTGSLLFSYVAFPFAAAFGAASVASVAQGGFLFSAEALALNPKRLNPATKLAELFSARGLSQALKSLLPFAVIAWISLAQLKEAWSSVTQLRETGISQLSDSVLRNVLPLAWRCLLVLIAWSFVDYLLQRQHMEGQLKMSREEIKEEMKESEGNPQVKAKIRRMQRQVRRQQMLHAVKRASVIVTNPTHFALALEYRDDMAAPVLVAKGLDRFAEEIKQMAMWYEVPMIENPPLAHALYRTVEVGQMIPAKLYAAVAEVLAAIYRAQSEVNRQKET